MRVRHDLILKVEWSKESADPDHNWIGLPMRGWRVVPEAMVKNSLVRAGLHPESPSWPQICWSKDYPKLDMRYTVSTARSWQSQHESMRSFLESVALSDERFQLASNHLRQLRREWRSKGPDARLFMKKRPIPNQHECVYPKRHHRIFDGFECVFRFGVFWGPQNSH